MAEKKVIDDVAKPGATPAAATSRPIIVGHATVLKRDPMVTKEESKESSDEPVPEKPLTVKAPKVIPVPDKTEPESVQESETAEASSVEAVASEPEKTEESSQKAVVDTLINEVDSKQAGKKEKADQQAKQAEAEKLIANKQYFVPIGQVSRRRSNIRAIVILVLFLIIAAAGVNFGIDAEMIDIGIAPLTNLL